MHKITNSFAKEVENVKKTLRSLFLSALILWLLVGLIPPAVYYLMKPSARILPPESSASPLPESPVPRSGSTAFRILDTAGHTVLEVSEADFLPLALLCEMSPDAPKEALKAQAVAIATHYGRLRDINLDSEYHFTCDTSKYGIYAPKEKWAERFNDEWDTIYGEISALCAEVAGQHLYYEGELITAPFFAISSGCTQPNENVWSGAPLPYLRGVACPFDVLHSAYRAVISFSPEEVKSAFPDVTFTDDPAAWFSAPTLYPSDYVEKISVCGTEYIGVEMRTALNLRSAAFSVEYADGAFQFTTNGHGHGVGMSQAGAIALAEQGDGYKDILSYFYPGTEIKTSGHE